MQLLMMRPECVSLQVCVGTLGLWISSVLAAGGWYPKALPCDVSLGSNYSVVNVDCTERELTFIPKGIPANTTNLTLTINHIPGLNSTSFLGLDNLTEIDMRCNCVPIKIGSKDRVCTRSVTIEDATFLGLRHLRALYLDGNQLHSIPTSLPQNLVLLSLEVNHIYSVLKENLSDVRNVEILYLGQNCYYRNPCNASYHVEEGAFLQLSNMTLLSLKSNNLSHIPSRLPSSLRELYLYNNKIEKVTEEDFQSLTQLEILDLSGNCPRCYNAPFPCVPCPHDSQLQIDKSAFKTLSKLRILRLHSNSLTYVLSEWFRNCTELRVLDLSSNFLAREVRFTYFPQALPNLEELDLSFNYELRSYPNTLQLSPSFSHLKSLRVLRIRGFVFQQLTSEGIKPLVSLENLEVIDLGTNFIKLADFSSLMEMKSIKIINLSDNKISLSSDGAVTVAFSGGDSYGSPMSGADYHSREVREVHYFRYDEYARSCKYRDKEVGIVNYFVNRKCSEFGKTLDISRNNIFFLHSEFLNFGEIRCLNLSGNAMSQSLNGSEFIHLSNLQYLDFSENRLDLLYSSAFQELTNLVILDISKNNHYFESEGLTHMLNFTKKLPNLKILLMNDNKISTSTNTELESVSLEKLEFTGNRLDLLWRDGDTRYIDYFKKLVNLKALDISKNNLNFIPKQVFRGLPDTLTELSINNNKLKSFAWEELVILRNLEVLDLSGNSLTKLPLMLSNCTRSLKKLYLQNNQISKLSQDFLKNAFSLKYLDLSSNRLQNIEPSNVPDDVVNDMDALLLSNNMFVCTCNATWFVTWLNSTTVNIPRLSTEVTCASPPAQRGHPVVSVDLQACQHSYLSIVLYILLTSLVLSFLTLSISSHLFLWDIWYIYHFCMAKFKGYGHLSSQGTVYDAFVVYDRRDPAVVDWVLRELRVQLEDGGDRCLRLCLEERDWIPGCPLIDNLSQSINQSKRTVFILTNSYIRSGNFKMAFYMAHQRLMDEKDDVIVLIFLEKAPSNSKYLRLRKRLFRRSVLEWPTNPQAQPYFWFSLRSVLATESQKQYSNLFRETL